MKIEKTATSYRVELAIKDMVAIMNAESHNVHPTTTIDPTLDIRLAALDGVSDVEYNGHYGAAVFFTVAAENDHRATQASVLSIIKTFIEEAKVFNDQNRTV